MRNLSLIIVAAECEQQIKFPWNPPGDDVAFDQCEWTLRNQVVCLELIVTLVVFAVCNCYQIIMLFKPATGSRLQLAVGCNEHIYGIIRVFANRHRRTCRN